MKQQTCASKLNVSCQLLVTSLEALWAQHMSSDPGTQRLLNGSTSCHVAMQDPVHLGSIDRRPGANTPLPGRPLGTARAEQIQLSPGDALRPPPVSLKSPFEWPNMLELLTVTPGKVTLFTMRLQVTPKY